MSSSYYVGIDQSLTSPGVTVLNESGGVEIATTVSVDDKLRGSARLAHIYRSFRSLVAPYPYPYIRRTALEGPSLGSTHREFDLGEVSGVTKIFLYSLTGCEPHVVPPTTLKSFATGNGLATKEDVLHVVKTIYGYDFGGRDDVADSFFLARICWAFDHPTLLRRRCELDALKAMLRKKKTPTRARAKSSL